jgi:zinc protease
MKIAFLIASLVLALAGVAQPAEAALKIERVVSPGGIEAWLMEDHRVPLMALDVTFRGGAALDPAGKEGLAALTASLLDEGAGNLNSTAFQKELADQSISLNFSADLDDFSGLMKTLTIHRDRAFQLLSLALTKPRFDADDVERDRNAMITSVETNLGNPNWVARRKLAETIFAGHPYARSSTGTVQSLRAITVADMRRYIKDRFGRDQLLVTAAGDITPEELGPLLDRTFGALPEKATPFTVPDIPVKGAGETVIVQRGIPQTIISMAKNGIKRNDPDWYAGQILNYALGGGGFNSRLMEDVRGAGTKRSLSYGVFSAFSAYRHAGIIQAGGATRNATAGETVGVIKGEFGHMQKDGITPAEIADAKIYLTGSLPLTLTSTDRIAALLMQLRVEDLGIDYLDRRDDLINGVTLEHANEVARRLLDPAALTTVLVGQPEGIEKASAPGGGGAASPTKKAER